MSGKDDTKKLIVAYNRRLQQLKEQKALLGISVDPRIPLEIQDIEAEITKLKEQLEKSHQAVESAPILEFTDLHEDFQGDISSLPIVQYDEANKPDVSTVITKFMRSSSDIVLHKGTFLAGPFRPPLQRALKTGKALRVLLCENHPAVNHQLWYRSERHSEEENGTDKIGSQIEAGLRNVDALRRTLTENEKKQFKVRLIPYIVPDPFCVVDRDRDNGLVLVYMRNFRNYESAAPFFIFRRSSAYEELFKFFVREFETLWEAATPYSDK